MIHRTWPDTTVVAIAPFLLDSATPPLGSRFVAFERRQVSRYGGSLIDPVTEGWVGPQNAWMIAAGTTYPNAAGNRYIARHLVADLRQLGVG